MSAEPSASGVQIAVIGMAGRFPGARNVEEFWENLRDGRESVRFFNDDELLAAGVSPEELADPAYVKAWPVLTDMDRFDAGFFGMSPRDAAVMDPQHRLFLECTWHALENAGYAPERSAPATGVFAACGMNTYMMHHLVRNAEVMRTVGEWLVRHTGNDMNFLATRVSYQMNLKGPSLNVQTACSSALVAVHLACQSLLNGECDMALAGASTLSLPQDRGYLFHEGEILAHDGHCRPFDAAAGGTLFGSGVGCVVLKRLADAIASGDRILGVICGSAINNDGSSKVGYLAPSVEGQARAISEALAIAGVEPDSISYVEAHGTGTAVGDPIEVAALTQAYRAYTARSGFCALGSVKGNIGHLGEAAGMAALIKTLLALGQRQLPPSINFQSPNPEIDFERSPFFVNTELRPWPETTTPRRAGITALGAGGTNVHLVLEEAPRPAISAVQGRSAQLLLLSAKTSSALERACSALAQHLAEAPSANLADVAYTLQLGRRHFNHRRALVVSSGAEAAAQLRARDAKLTAQLSSRVTPSVVFMFPGGGAQYASMGAELYAREPVYRAAFDECLRALPYEFAAKLKQLVLADEAGKAAATRELERPANALPALFATEYATSQLLGAWGVEPVAYIGHSMGEYVAASLAGVFSVADGMGLVAARGRLFETLPAGGMLSVALPEAELLPLLGSELSVAAVNAPALCVASGPVAAIEELERVLAERGVDSTRIHISVAAHSAMLVPILAEFESYCRRLRFQAPTRPFVSNLTGTWITPAEATDPLYWVRHLRGTVRFAEGIAEILRGGERVLLEVGPGRTLSSLSKQQASTPKAYSSLRHPQEAASDVEFLTASLARLWLAGAELAFERLHEGQARSRVALPGYPFESQRHWVEPDVASMAPAKTGPLRKHSNVTDWFYAPCFQRAAAAAPDDSSGPWLVFADPGGLCEASLAQLSGRKVIWVAPNESFVRLSDDRYAMRAEAPVDYDFLLNDLALRELTPSHVVYGWSLSGKPAMWPLNILEHPSPLEELARAERTCFLGLLYLAQALGAQEIPVVLSIVSNGLHGFESASAMAPEKSLLLGPLRVIPREFPQIRTRSIDVLTPRSRQDIEQIAAPLARELTSNVDEQVVALRPSGRWAQRHQAVPLSSVVPGQSEIRQGGVYLITGGLGGIGLALAEYLSRSARAKLVLVGRTGLPDRASWPKLLAERDAQERRIRKVLEIEAHGGQVLAVGADVTSLDDMRGVVELTRERFGTINGVIHSAGLIDDGLISLKTQDAAARVVGVKARGALVLEAALGRQDLDFFVVFSSISSVLGLEGQVDYTAANAFLDAFAERRSTSGKTRTVSIGWNAWREMGMAVSLAEQPAGVELAGAGKHPCLERVAIDDAGQTLFTSSLSRTKHWLLSEHVVHGGSALIPGTGYLELARAGLQHHARNAAVEMRDVTFLTPFVVGVGESRELRLRIVRSGDEAGEFRFFSDSEDEPHVTGQIAHVERVAPAAADLAALRARCNESERIYNGFLDGSFMDFGPRWANVERVSYGRGEALLTLQLPAAFNSDLAAYQLHPALLDMATGGAQALLPGFDPAKDSFVPFAYGRLTQFAPLKPRCFSHVRHRPSASPDLALFEISIYDESGNLLVEIGSFTMKRIADARQFTSTSKPAHSIGQGPERLASVETRISTAVRLGIENHEGMDAFERILAARLGGAVIASSVDLHAWLAEIEQRLRPAPAPREADGPVSVRPSLSRDFVGPRNDVERELAAVWRELLGLSQVGVHDDFFEVGGTSLVAVRLFNRIRKRYGVSLPLSTLFEAPNIEGCAKIIAEDLGLAPQSYSASNGSAANGAAAATNGATHDGSSSQGDVAASNGNGHHASEPPPASERGSSDAKKVRWPTLVVMQPKGPPPAFFCVAGLGGNLNNLRKLALLAGDDRPVYGLQPPGADDPTKLIYSVDELSDHYLKEVRRVQPVGPYFLGGYSGGGITAFEMSRKLSAAGEQIAFLGLIDSYSPELPMRSKLERAQIHLQRLQKDGPRYAIGMLERRAGYERYELKRRISRTLRKAFPGSFRYEQVEDSWLIAQAAYKPPPWDGHATLFRAREIGSMSLWTAFKDDEEHGWGRYLLRGLDVKLCPGNHNTMCEEPNVRVLAAQLREELKRAAESFAARREEALAERAVPTQQTSC
jgi:acyl transferase domain-containing protein/thioesterase domain-containing protein